MARARASKFSAGAMSEKRQGGQKGIGLAAPDEEKEDLSSMDQHV
jgi:hypothetical protein